MNSLKILAASALIFSLISCTHNGQTNGREAYKNRIEKHDDAKVISQVRKAIVLNPLLPNELIHLAIDRGVVQLSGFMRSPEEANVAVLTVENISGVTEVINSLIIPEGIKASPKNRHENDTDLRLIAQVEHNFRISSAVPNGLIHVGAHRGVVQLSGFVKNAEDASQAAMKAIATKGVVEVVNDIVVMSSDEYIAKRIKAEVKHKHHEHIGAKRIRR